MNQSMCYSILTRRFSWVARHHRAAGGRSPVCWQSRAIGPTVGKSLLRSVVPETFGCGTGQVLQVIIRPPDRPSRRERRRRRGCKTNRPGAHGMHVGCGNIDITFVKPRRACPLCNTLHGLLVFNLNGCFANGQMRPSCQHISIAINPTRHFHAIGHRHIYNVYRHIWI